MVVSAFAENAKKAEEKADAGNEKKLGKRGLLGLGYGYSGLGGYGKCYYIMSISITNKCSSSNQYPPWPVIMEICHIIPYIYDLYFVIGGYGGYGGYSGYSGHLGYSGLGAGYSSLGSGYSSLGSAYSVGHAAPVAHHATYVQPHTHSHSHSVVEKPVVVDRPVVVEKPVYVEKHVPQVRIHLFKNIRWHF